MYDVNYFSRTRCILCSGGFRGYKRLSPPECAPEKVYEYSCRSRTSDALVSSVLIMGGSEKAKHFRNYLPEVAVLECHSGRLLMEQFNCRQLLSLVDHR